ncbi:uncharacterized protein UV8b_03570 [Ustilaginoidea virens]|uniref:Cyclin-dependent kinase n=1 Tax=Ustilaginoidea virens TaxID=1159556 RepID=A0A8E5HPV0_USTVR|nr:uncharacterized protein UV8b_03570 [Ustilaginoidea virens]QUC19329.1 hypothetical protein UV8b_03570 [Ustilaginoidea virens]
MPSPAKHRAALAPLDPNAKPSLPSPKMKDGAGSPIPLTGGSSPTKKVAPARLGGTKRPAEDASSPGCKKTCTAHTHTPTPTHTPTSPASSVFDTSAAEGDSWATAATEPDLPGRIVGDAPALLAPRQRGSMTREQAREKAEILRLRLTLANYKLRTGQTAIPLADLQRKPLPPRRVVRVQPPSGSHQGSRDASAPSADGLARSNGGAASGLLSLSRG